MAYFVLMCTATRSRLLTDFTHKYHPDGDMHSGRIRSGVCNQYWKLNQCKAFILKFSSKLNWCDGSL